MTSQTTAVVEFKTPDVAENCLERGVYSWDGGRGIEWFRVERFGKNLFFHSKHIDSMS